MQPYKEIATKINFTLNSPELIAKNLFSGSQIYNNINLAALLQKGTKKGYTIHV